ncbi:MAG: NADH:ubiquinone oxidoreductase [Chrysothrix sp. TS-e1954]|nr:MAG: NADH:ubiquinone oxidoreductase [Chrysothrix sp. TS-e1954]
MANAPSSPAPPGFSNLQEEIAYYKSQYEQLETELQEFQASSKELEAELEKDVEASEKRERTLKQKVESLNYEVDEWKTKYKQSKAEANNAQNSLQKEITSLRDTSRTQQMRLRDMEVANDDYERQTRNTTSSLEDMESKYNLTIERGVMLEEEVKTGEQERESLRIETQRLRDELSDLKIEAEIMQEKLRAAEGGYDRRTKRVSHLSDTRDQVPHSPISDTSTSLASAITPPTTKSESSAVTSEATTPPSPPLSETSNANGTGRERPSTAKPKPASGDSHITPKPLQTSTMRSPHKRGPSTTPGNVPTPAFKRRDPAATPRVSTLGNEGPPRSGSLYQLRGIIGKMQMLEQRVHSARSKLPAPTTTPPRASPRGTSPRVGGAGTSNLSNNIPATVTMRSGKKRSSASTANSVTPSRPTEDNIRSLSRRQSRISFVGTDTNRPSSRASHTSGSQFARPSSRTSDVNSRMGTHEAYRPPSSAGLRRLRSSMSGTLSARGHRVSQNFVLEDQDSTPTPRRMADRNEGDTAIPVPSGLGRRQSTQGLSAMDTARRKSTKTHSSASSLAGYGRMDPPDKRHDNAALGETF